MVACGTRGNNGCTYLGCPEPLRLGGYPLTDEYQGDSIPPFTTSPGFGKMRPFARSPELLAARSLVFLQLPMSDVRDPYHLGKSLLIVVFIWSSIQHLTLIRPMFNSTSFRALKPHPMGGFVLLSIHRLILIFASYVSAIRELHLFFTAKPRYESGAWEIR